MHKEFTYPVISIRISKSRSIGLPVSVKICWPIYSFVYDLRRKSLEFFRRMYRKLNTSLLCLSPPLHKTSLIQNLSALSKWRSENIWNLRFLRQNLSCPHPNTYFLKINQVCYVFSEISVEKKNVSSGSDFEFVDVQWWPGSLIF
jgi:hypothetical protein